MVLPPHSMQCRDNAARSSVSVLQLAAYRRLAYLVGSPGCLFIWQIILVVAPMGNITQWHGQQGKTNEAMKCYEEEPHQTKDIKSPTGMLGLSHLWS